MPQHDPYTCSVYSVDSTSAPRSTKPTVNTCHLKTIRSQASTPPPPTQVPESTPFPSNHHVYQQSIVPPTPHSRLSDRQRGSPATYPPLRYPSPQRIYLVLLLPGRRLRWVYTDLDLRTHRSIKRGYTYCIRIRATRQPRTEEGYLPFQ